MPVTGTQLWSSSRARIGRNFQDSMLDFASNPDGVLTAINAGLSDLTHMENWDWMYRESDLPVQKDQDTYDVPERHVTTSFISRENALLIARQRKQSVAYSFVRARPVGYWVGGGSIYLWPIPSADESLRHGYYVSLPRVTDLSGDIDLPDQFRSLAELFIARHIAMLVNDLGQYRVAGEALNEEKKAIRDLGMRSTTPGIPQVRRDTGF